MPRKSPLQFVLDQSGSSLGRLFLPAYGLFRQSLYYSVKMLQGELAFLHGQAVPKCIHHIGKHFDGYYTLQYTASGIVDLNIDAENFRLKGRWFWSAYPGPFISFRPGAGSKFWNHRYIAFTGSLVSRWTADGLFPIPPQCSPGGHDYGRQFDRLLQLADQNDRAGHRRAVHLLEGILLDLAEQRIVPIKTEPWIDRAMTRLSDDDIDCPSLAVELGVSESTFRRRFHESTGVSPVEFRIQQRIGLARRLLSETTDPIKTISTRLGYRDVFFFTRQFTKRVGVAPAVYRKSRQG